MEKGIPDSNSYRTQNCQIIIGDKEIGSKKIKKWSTSIQLAPLRTFEDF